MAPKKSDRDDPLIDTDEVGDLTAEEIVVMNELDLIILGILYFIGASISIMYILSCINAYIFFIGMMFIEPFLKWSMQTWFLYHVAIWIIKKLGRYTVIHTYV
jgi:hypothetical protein